MTILDATPPTYGLHYGAGWIGFCHHHTFVSNAIMWLTRWWRKPSTPAVSHVFVVTDPCRCIEANMDGVEQNDLSEYFNNPDYTVYLRKPFGWTPEMGQAIVESSAHFLGQEYCFELIVADALSYTIVGRIVNGLTGGELNRLLTKLADDPREQICDKVAILALQAQAGLRDRGSLIRPARESNPQKLFEDEQIFCDRTYRVRGAISN